MNQLLYKTFFLKSFYRGISNYHLYVRKKELNNRSFDRQQANLYSFILSISKTMGDLFQFEMQYLFHPSVLTFFGCNEYKVKDIKVVYNLRT